VNQVKTRLQALGLLDRTFSNMSDDALVAIIEAMPEDHRDAFNQLIGTTEADPAAVRATATKGRLDGTMESLALVLTDKCLADCIEQLGDHAENPTTDQLQAVTPGLVERHGLPLTQMMLASTVVGEAPASAIIRDLLKNDELVKLPPAEPKPISPIITGPEVSPEERAAIKAKRHEMRQRKQEEARARREQSARDRNRL
jgi:hypothetical protein